MEGVTGVVGKTLAVGPLYWCGYTLQITIEIHLNIYPDLIVKQHGAIYLSYFPTTNLSLGVLANTGDKGYLRNGTDAAAVPPNE